MEYLITILISICIWAILGISWNIIAGYSKLFALCQSAFYGIGAYSTGVLMTKWGWAFFPSLLAGMLIAAIVALLIALPSLRVHSDYFVVISLAFLYVFHHSVKNVPLTGAASGIKSIPLPSILGWTIASSHAFLALSIILLIVVYMIARQIVRSAYGRTLLAVGEDELAASSVGKNVTAVKVSSVLIGAALAAIGGSLYACHVRYINPNDFFLEQTFLVVCIVILGGLKNINGTILGAIILVMVPELMRFTPLPSAIIGPLTGVFYGVVLVAIMLLRPHGLLGERKKG